MSVMNQQLHSLMGNSAGISGGGTVTSTTKFNNDVDLAFGTTNAAATASRFRYSTAQTVDSLMLGLDETSRSLHICDYGDVAFNFATSAQTHPTLFLHSNAQSTTQFATLSQTGTNLEIKNTGAAGSTTVFTGGSSGTALQSASDQNILVGGGGFLALRSTSTSFRESNGIECFASSKGFYMSNARFQFKQGADVSAAGDLTLGTDGNVHEITGSGVTINAITDTSWQTGGPEFLVFGGVNTIKHNTAGSAGTTRFWTSTGADITTAAGVLYMAVLAEQGGVNYWRIKA